MASEDGLNELAEALAKLQSSMVQQLPGIVGSAAGIIEREIHARMRVDTGSMAHNLEIQQSQTARKAEAVVQVADSGPGQAQHYAIYQEYGTSKMPARPFFRPGVAAARQAAEQKIIAGVTNLVAQHAG